MTYYVTLELKTKRALGTVQQDRLREAVLSVLDLGCMQQRADMEWLFVHTSWKTARWW